jgi:hypothetical protein
MNWPLLLPVGLRPSDRATASRGRKISQPRTACAFAQLWTFALALLCASALAAQVLTIDTSGKGATADKGPVERKYAQIKPTKVELPKDALDAKTRLLLIRALQSEQGFAMRPFPRGHKGLQLAANGKLEPAGEAYLKMVTHEGLSAKPGERLTITDLKIERAKIVFDLNGGPDAKHRFLRHIQISAGSAANAPEEDSAPDSQANEPVGARLTLSFADRVPALSPEELKALIEPLISFDLKSPIQTFTDALPPPLKEAILAHKVLVGMTAEMALYAKGQRRANTFRGVDLRRASRRSGFRPHQRQSRDSRRGGFKRQADADFFNRRGLADARSQRPERVGAPGTHAHHQRGGRGNRSRPASAESPAQPAQSRRKAARRRSEQRRDAPGAAAQTAYGGTNWRESRRADRRAGSSRAAKEFRHGFLQHTASDQLSRRFIYTERSESGL